MSETWETAWALLRPGERLLTWQDASSSVIYGRVSCPDSFDPDGRMAPRWTGHALTLEALLIEVLAYLRLGTR